MNDDDFGNLSLVKTIFDILFMLHLLGNTSVCHNSRALNAIANSLAKRGSFTDGNNIVWSAF